MRRCKAIESRSLLPDLLDLRQRLGAFTLRLLISGVRPFHYTGPHNGVSVPTRISRLRRCFQGWMEQTALFVGFYSDREFSTSVLRSYNLPLAYLACTLVYFLISLVSILSQ